MSGEKRRFVIKPFRPHSQMDEAAARRTWESLREAIGEIYKKNASVLSFEELYRNAYNLVLDKHGDLLYDGVQSTIRERVEWISSRIRSADDSALVGRVCSLWEDHKTTMEMVKDILMYVDRTYAAQRRKLPVFDLGLVEFRRAIREETTMKRLRSLLLESVDVERSRSGMVDRPSLKTALHMLVQLGAVDGTPVYEDDFEKQFLKESEAYFASRAAEWSDSMACVDYVRKVEACLVEEDRDYLHPSTRPKVIRLVEIELIEAKSKTLVSGFCSLLDGAEENMEDLKRMRHLLARCPSTMEQLRDALYGHIRREGEALLDSARGAASTWGRDNAPGGGGASSSSSLFQKDKSTSFVRSLLAARDKYHAVVHDALQGETAAQKKLNDAFEGFINRDANCTRSLVIYVDELMRSKQQQQEADDDALDKIIVIFRYIHDKDVFEDVYKHYLANRLLGNRSVSHEYEKQMLTKLKTECGYQFTTKLEGMFADMSISKDVMEDYSSFLANKRASEDLSSSSSTEGRRHQQQQRLELGVTMLTQGFWPIRNAHRFRLPQSIEERCVAPFEEFYLTLHSKRKLSWQTSLGSASVIRTQRSSNGDVEHELTVTTQQMCMLMLFNDKPKVTLDEVVEATQIQPLSEIKRHLVSLCTPKHPILLKKSKGKGITADDEFEANRHFQSKLKRVKIPLLVIKDNSSPGNIQGASSSSTSTPLDMVSAGGDGIVSRAVLEDRRHMVEAYIVRIMKARRHLHHNDLIAEVTRQLMQRFYPQPQFIKKSIESLLDREYIERSEKDSRVYNYLA